MMTRRFLFTLVLPVVVMGTLAVLFTMPLFRLEGAPPPAEGAPPLAGPQRVVAQGVIETVSEERDIGAEIPGKIRALHVEEGDWVTAGQILAELENDDLQARLAAAEATIRLRQAELDRLNNGARLEERQVARAELREAEAALTLARQNYQRRERLAGKNVVSIELLDEARANLRVAEARQSMLSSRLELVLAPPRREDVAIAEANLATVRADAARARADLDKTIIRAPGDGVVLRRYRLAGEVVGIVTNQAPMPIVRIGDLRRLRVRAEIDETDVTRIALGQRAYITTDAFGPQRFWGTVSRIGPMMGRKRVLSDDPVERLDTQVLDIRIDLEDGAVSLPIGLRVDTFILDATPAAPQITGHHQDNGQ